MYQFGENTSALLAMLMALTCHMYVFNKEFDSIPNII